MAKKPITSRVHGGGAGQAPRRTICALRWRWAAGAVVVWALAGPALTQSCFADWKLFDGASTLDPALCFFDASGVTRARGRDVGVWTKCVGQREIEAVAPTGPTGRAIAARDAQAILAGYVPPAASLYGLDSDGLRSVISYKSAADLAGLKARSATYYDLNCARGTVRALRLSSEAATAAGFRGTPSALDAATPRGSGASLLQLLCGLNVAVQPRLAPGRPTTEQTRVRRPTHLVHVALAANQIRMHIGELTQRPRITARRPPPAASRAASASSLDAPLRPRLS